MGHNLVELESPEKQFFTKNQNRPTPTADFTAALAQVQEWRAHLRVKPQTLIDALKPLMQGALRDNPMTIRLRIKTDLFAEFIGNQGSSALETCPLALTRRGAETRLILEGSAAREPEPDPVLIKGLAQAHRWWKDLLSQRYATMHAYQTDERYVARIIMLAFLSTAVTRQILDGTHPTDLTLHSFLKNDQPWLAPPLA